MPPPPAGRPSWLCAPFPFHHPYWPSHFLTEIAPACRPPSRIRRARSSPTSRNRAASSIRPGPPSLRPSISGLPRALSGPSLPRSSRLLPVPMHGLPACAVDREPALSRQSRLAGMSGRRDPEFSRLLRTGHGFDPPARIGSVAHPLGCKRFRIRSRGSLNPSDPDRPCRRQHDPIPPRRRIIGLLTPLQPRASR